MFKSYIKTTWRNLVRHKSYTFINLLGLSVAMACCILISLYVKEELSYDKLHENADRIVVMSTSEDSRFTPPPLANVLTELPDIEAAARRTSNFSNLNVSYDGNDFVSISTSHYVDQSFLEIFSFEWISGDKSTALTEPNSIVLTEEHSQQLFGDENPVGESLIWQQEGIEGLEPTSQLVLQVTGVIENEPSFSNVDYGSMISISTQGDYINEPLSWRSSNTHTYALLHSVEAIERLPAQLELLEEHYIPKGEDGTPLRNVYATPFTDLHLSNLTPGENFTGDKTYFYLFVSVAFLILLIAWVNYVNLATARASLRTREVGIRKTVGAGRMQIAGQFIGESVSLSMCAFFIGCGIALWALPTFNELFGTHLEWHSIGLFPVWLGLTAVSIGVLGGLYPALYLSGFAPISVLRDRFSPGTSGSLFRKGLMVTQFTIVVVLIIGSLVIYQQIQFAQTVDLGFRGDQVVIVRIPDANLWEQQTDFRNRLVNHPAIVDVSIASGVPGEFNVGFMSMRPSAFSVEAEVESDDRVRFVPAGIDDRFLNLLDIELLAGRNFDAGLVADREYNVILNETGVYQLGWNPEEAVGKPYGSNGEVIGVVEDFYISSLHDEISTTLLSMDRFGIGSFWMLAKLNADRVSEGLDEIQTEFERFVPEASFNYEFLDDKFAAMYETERRLGMVMGLFTVITIVIACLGLYALSVFIAERRVKEIGIRKVLGATLTNIVALLSRDFIQLMLISFLLAAPVGWYVMSRWLDNFAYKIELGLPLLLFVGVISVLIMFGTIGWNSIRAALANPVNSLRSE